MILKAYQINEDENKDFKISTKVEMNNKGRDIVEKNIKIHRARVFVATSKH